MVHSYSIHHYSNSSAATASNDHLLLLTHTLTGALRANLRTLTYCQSKSVAGAVKAASFGFAEHASTTSTLSCYIHSSQTGMHFHKVYNSNVAAIHHRQVMLRVIVAARADGPRTHCTVHSTYIYEVVLRACAILCTGQSNARTTVISSSGCSSICHASCHCCTLH
jgi:hypothetical protein